MSTSWRVASEGSYPHDQREFEAFVRYMMRPSVSLARLHFTPAAPGAPRFPRIGLTLIDDVYVMNADGSEQTRLTDRPNATDLLAGSTPIDPDAFERETLRALGMPAEVVMRHRTPQFGHVFAGDGYSAGYYSYLWADTLTADAWEAFTEAGGPYDEAVARRFLERVLSVGNTVEPAEAYRAFRGRDAGIDALMRDRGFPVPAAPKTD